jgi:putative effector of murein hydrolase LrgA (UPF0299 family)
MSSLIVGQRVHQYLAQVICVAALTTLSVLVTDWLQFRNPANLLWMVVLPVVLAFAVNDGWNRRAFMALLLVLVSLGTGIVVGVSFTSYG